MEAVFGNGLMIRVFESSKHHDNKLATSAAVLTSSKVTFPPNIVCLSLDYRAVTLVMLYLPKI